MVRKASFLTAPQTWFIFYLWVWSISNLRYSSLSEFFLNAFYIVLPGICWGWAWCLCPIFVMKMIHGLIMLMIYHLVQCSSRAIQLNFNSFSSHHCPIVTTIFHNRCHSCQYLHSTTHNYNSCFLLQFVASEKRKMKCKVS